MCGATLVVTLAGGCRDGQLTTPSASGSAPAPQQEAETLPEPAVDNAEGALVDDGAQAAALRETLATLRAQEPPPLRAGATLEAFYEGRHYRPVLLRSGRLVPGAAKVIEAVRSVGDHGLSLKRYDVDRLADAMAAETTNPIRLELEVLDLWLVVGAHLLGGAVDPKSIHADWNISPRQRDLVEALRGAAETGDLADALLALAPSQPGYQRLLAALARYRAAAAAGGWPALPKTSPLREGDDGADVVALRERLRAEGDLQAVAAGSFDADVVEAIKAAQIRYGLTASGQLDATTTRALGVAASDRADQIAANLERWRWLPEDLGSTHVRVNIAAFEVEAWKDGARVSSMKAVVGKLYRETPVFSDSITHVVLNPRWSVPIKLAVKDVLPKIQKDPAFLRKHGFKVFSATTGAEVDPADVPWGELGPRKFAYILRQEPGPDNALGQLKIMFPNPHDVYLHDTPKRHLFKEAKRAFSSGCVRLEDPRGLAVFLLDDARWDRARIDKAIATGREQTVWLRQPVPVHLQYWTAWVDADGTVHFRDDLYGRDDRLVRALAAAG